MNQRCPIVVSLTDADVNVSRCSEKSGHNNSILTIDICIIQQKEFQCNESKKKTEIKQWEQNKKIKTYQKNRWQITNVVLIYQMFRLIADH